jgi:hypothetical protein
VMSLFTSSHNSDSPPIPAHPINIFIRFVY